MIDRDPDCLFCKIVAGGIPSRRVDEDERTVAFMDISPATRGHVLVIPRCQGDPMRLPSTPSPGDPGDISAAAAQLR